MPCGPGTERRYRNIEEWKKGPYFFSHITEIIRLASLYKYGGVYLDTDVIVMRDLGSLRNCLGTELAGSQGEAKILNGAPARAAPHLTPHVRGSITCQPGPTPPYVPVCPQDGAMLQLSPVPL